jgi:5-methylcytosine-specific restriction endonuclease McrA
LQRHPLCDHCQIKPSVVADHRIPARVVHAECVRRGLFPLQRVKGFHIQENLVGKCHGCHNAKTADEPGKDYSAELDELLSRFKPGFGD